MSIALFLLDVLHQVVEDVFGLKFLLFGSTGVALLSVKNSCLVSETGLEVVRLDLVSNEVLLHTLEHMFVGATRHLFLGDFVVSIGKTILQLRESFLVVSNRAFDLSLLDVKTLNFLPDSVVLVLFHRDKFLGLVVLLLDLG